MNGIDGNTRNKIVSFLFDREILELSQVNKEFAFACALEYCEKYAEAVVANRMFSSDVLQVLNRVIEDEDVIVIAALIVEKIFKICRGNVLLRKTSQLSSLIMNLMTNCSIADVDYDKVHSRCGELKIPVEVIKHNIHSCIIGNYFFVKKSTIGGNPTADDLIIEYIRSRVGEDDSSGDEAEPKRDPGKRVKWDNEHVAQILPELVKEFGGTTQMKLKQFRRHPEHGNWFIEKSISLKQIKERLKSMKYKKNGIKQANKSS